MRAAPLLRGRHVSSAVLATARDTVRVDFTAAAPATPSLGPSCVGGGLLSEDSQRIGVITDGVPLTGVAVDRLFNSGQPVPIPAVTIDRAADAMILSPADGAAWPIGDYALTIRADGQARVVPFCVGRLIRLVDYSLIAFVPRGVDGVSARRLLVAGAGND